MRLLNNILYELGPIRVSLTHRPYEVTSIIQFLPLPPSQLYFYCRSRQEWRSVADHFAIRWRIGVPPEANCCVYMFGRPQELFPLEVIQVEAPDVSQRMVLPHHIW
ncbi:hypothetical protein GCK72_004601 [Caenorhabditis remanei]|uniref:Uncharacterized protein n=1 Tax=Caenorhabditis remanei TaxID=31234 RepID=A0A6A5HEB8_CAERE|nr:hypothetical protein GCK72_004601 [Caenorhabditis remanei]KAF1764652.1 hypothetical protein GCK72_004601 [Caenorhabditis remanei]